MVGGLAVCNPIALSKLLQRGIECISADSDQRGPVITQGVQRDGMLIVHNVLGKTAERSCLTDGINGALDTEVVSRRFGLKLLDCPKPRVKCCYDEVL